jgi:hypothetical protein
MEGPCSLKKCLWYTILGKGEGEEERNRREEGEGEGKRGRRRGGEVGELVNAVCQCLWSTILGKEEGEEARGGKRKRGRGSEGRKTKRGREGEGERRKGREARELVNAFSISSDDTDTITTRWGIYGMSYAFSPR